MAAPPTESTHGILVPGGMGHDITLNRHAPSDDLAGIVERFWVVRWCLEPEPLGALPREQATLPFPAVNVVVGDHQPGVFGPMSARFVATLSGRGAVFGVKFRPAGFRGLLARGLSPRDLVDAVRTPGEAFVDGAAAAAWQRELQALAHVASEEDTGSARVRLTETLVRAQHAGLSQDDQEANAIVDCARSDSTLTRVGDLAARAGLGVRALERLLRSTVGVPPKWILRRFRVQEAAARLAAHPHQHQSVDLASLALDLGYADQPHFIRDFRAQTGHTPTHYLALCRARAAPLDGPPPPTPS